MSKKAAMGFLSTLSLRRATQLHRHGHAAGRDFYPRSPCGERPGGKIHDPRKILFLSTLSLRRATKQAITAEQTARISIHALLAESDYTAICKTPPTQDFYPRSPCGERPLGAVTSPAVIRFLSTLSLRRATGCNAVYDIPVTISIHALLAESDQPRSRKTGKLLPFLSTLSLRRATSLFRSPQATSAISIHALLAESDRYGVRVAKIDLAFLSTLSLRRATTSILHKILADWDFYPRSPCGERPVDTLASYRAQINFYPRSPCGERRRDQIKR